jgi:hypothetical protein
MACCNRGQFLSYIAYGVLRVYQARRSDMENNETTAPGKLELIAVKSFKNYDDMYKVVNFLNNTLKDKKIIFGLTRDSANGTVTISIYES